MEDRKGCLGLLVAAALVGLLFVLVLTVGKDNGESLAEGSVEVLRQIGSSGVSTGQPAGDAMLISEALQAASCKAAGGTWARAIQACAPGRK